VGAKTGNEEDQREGGALPYEMPAVTHHPAGFEIQDVAPGFRVCVKTVRWGACIMRGEEARE
jgi:hypothetical protein